MLITILKLINEFILIFVVAFLIIRFVGLANNVEDISRKLDDIKERKDKK